MTNLSLKEDGRPATMWYWDDWFSSFDVRACGLAARGLWIDMLGIMARAEIKGTLSINGKQVDGRTLAQITGTTEIETENLLCQLEDRRVFSRLQDGTIINRRMFNESQRQDEISKIKSEAGKKGAETRWGAQKNGTKIAETETADNKGITEDDGKITGEKDSKGIAEADGEMIAKMALPSSSSIPPPSPIKKDSRESYAPSDKKNRSKPPSIIFNFETGKFENISDGQKKKWAAAFPAVDIELFIKRMEVWQSANPDKKKNRYERAFANWLRGEQDSGGSKGGFYARENLKSGFNWEVARKVGTNTKPTNQEFWKARAAKEVEFKKQFADDPVKVQEALAAWSQEAGTGKED